MGLVQRVTVLSALLCSSSALATGVSNRHIGFGIALGGGTMIGLVAVYRWLAQGLLRPGAQQWYRLLFWLVWILKWPVIGLVFYLACRHGAASPIGLVIGISVVPAAAVGIVLWALLAQAWPRRRGAGGER